MLFNINNLIFVDIGNYAICHAIESSTLKLHVAYLFSSLIVQPL